MILCFILFLKNIAPCWLNLVFKKYLIFINICLPLCSHCLASKYVIVSMVGWLGWMTDLFTQFKMFRAKGGSQQSDWMGKKRKKKNTFNYLFNIDRFWKQPLIQPVLQGKLALLAITSNIFDKSKTFWVAISDKYTTRLVYLKGGGI